MTTMRVVSMAPGEFGVEVGEPEFSLGEVSRCFPECPDELHRRPA